MSALLPLALPLAVAFSAVLVLVVDLGLDPRNPRRGRVLGLLTAGLLTAVLVGSFLVDTRGTTAFGAYQGDAWAVYFARLFLAAGVLAVLAAMAHLERAVPHRQGEYHLLLLFSLVGLLLLPGARDLLVLVVAFELMGLPLYVLAAYAKNDRDPHGPAAEASLKLYLVGATSTAITLFGVALVVGLAGTTRLSGLLAPGALQPITVVGLMLVLAGFGFKLGLPPFHMWVPDTYQGAPTPFVAFLSVAPKAGGVAALVAVFALAAGRPGPWLSAMAVLAALAMVLGNLLALPQTDTRRLLGYSGVAQVGYVLIAVATLSAEGLGMAAFYLGTYVFANMGTFMIVEAVGPDRAALAGLSRRSPWLAAALLVFLLSLAGIPFVAGFWAKMFVFLAAYRAGLTVLVVVGALLAVVGLFYYMQLARAAFMVEPGLSEPPRVGRPLGVAIAICLLAVVGLGLWPRLLHDAASEAGASLAAARSERSLP
jgi:NADH-quinone oxidoreductase subunit N